MSMWVNTISEGRISIPTLTNYRKKFWHSNHNESLYMTMVVWE